jgi:hypothetical protein
VSVARRDLVSEARCETIIRCEVLGEADAARIAESIRPALNAIDLDQCNSPPEIRGQMASKLSDIQEKPCSSKA